MFPLGSQRRDKIRQTTYSTGVQGLTLGLALELTLGQVFGLGSVLGLELELGLGLGLVLRLVLGLALGLGLGLALGLALGLVLGNYSKCEHFTLPIPTSIQKPLHLCYFFALGITRAR